MRLVLLSLFGVFCLSSCNLVDSNVPVVVTSIQEGIVLDMWNPLDTQSKFALTLATIDDQCATTEIRTQSRQSGNDISVSILGLALQPNCTGERQSISTMIPANVSQGFYDVSIELSESVINTGRLTYNGTYYDLQMNTTDGIVIGHDRLYRIPENIIWGTLLSDNNIHTANSEWIENVNDFTISADLTEGYYGHFTVLDADVLVGPTSEHLFSYPFVLRLTGDMADLEYAIADIRLAYSGQLELQCFTWDGQTL